MTEGAFRGFSTDSDVIIHKGLILKEIRMDASLGLGMIIRRIHMDSPQRALIPI
jgi:hypothetical protein